MPLGTRIRKAREQAHISQAELAQRIGISKTAMNAIEEGGTDPRTSRIVAITQELGVSTDVLLLGTPATGKRQHKPPVRAPSAPVIEGLGLRLAEQGPRRVHTQALRRRPRTAAPAG